MLSESRVRVLLLVGEYFLLFTFCALAHLACVSFPAACFAFNNLGPVSLPSLLVFWDRAGDSDRKEL